jgi:hypothetical protein
MAVGPVPVARRQRQLREVTSMAYRSREVPPVGLEPHWADFKSALSRSSRNGDRLRTRTNIGSNFR